MERRIIPISREITAKLVPIGTEVVIPKGTFVTLTQSLGNSYTVVHNGNMARVDSADADALGFEVDLPQYQPNQDGSVNLDDVHRALRSVYDPEIPVNIVDLGLIYGCELKRLDGKQIIQVRMTLTAPGCGMGPVLIDEVKSRVARVPGVDEVEVELVFDPPWSRDCMSEEAQLELGIF